jgi:mycofactocin precursor
MEESLQMERSANPTSTIDATANAENSSVEAESLIEEVSIDGMCGVY